MGSARAETCNAFAERSSTMQIGMIWLGRMGANIVRRLLRTGHSCVVYDRDPAQALGLEREGAEVRPNLALLIEALAAPRLVWIMLPAGAATDAAIAELSALMQPGD